MHRYQPIPTDCSCSPAEHDTFRWSARNWNSLKPIGVMPVDAEAGWFTEMRNCPSEGTLAHDVPSSGVEKVGGKWKLRPDFRWTEHNINFTFED